MADINLYQKYRRTVKFHKYKSHGVIIIAYRGMKWPSGLRRRLRRAPSPVRTLVMGDTSLRTSV